MLDRENDWPDYAPASEPINRAASQPRQHGRMPGGHPSSLFDGSAARMARKQVSKASGKVAKEKLQLTLDPDVAHKLRLAALASRMDLSELVTSLVLKEFSGLHIRGFDKASEPQAGAGQGSLAVAPSVSIKGVSNRINDIARGSTAPRDEALNSFMSE
jgi:hypothetical protein